jgi:hypothetical protein
MALHRDHFLFATMGLVMQLLASEQLHAYPLVRTLFIVGK